VPVRAGFFAGQNLGDQAGNRLDVTAALGLDRQRHSPHRRFLENQIFSSV
jgi:hypothetical protein